MSQLLLYNINHSIHSETLQGPYCYSAGKDSTGKRTSSRYHPYTATVNKATSDNISDIPDDINTNQMEDSNAMDIEG